MNLIVVGAIGMALGVIEAAGIFFEPKEPYKIQILLAGTLKGLLVALLTGFSLSPGSSWLDGLGFGLLYGALFGLVIFLAKGGPVSKDAPYVIPMSAITGAICGLLIIWLAF
jgi:hypothetical protein